MRFIRYFLVCVLCLLAGVVYSRELPKIKNWILLKIQNVSREDAHVEIKAKSIDFSIFPPGVELKGLDVLPQKELTSVLAPATIKSLGVYLSPSSLLAGRFEIGNIVIDQPSVSIFIRKTETGKAPGASEGNSNSLFDQIINVPLRKLTVTNAEIRAKIESADILVQLTHFGFKAEKTYKAGQVDIFAPDLELKKASGPDRIVTLGLATRIVAESNAAEIAALKIAEGGNFLMARGVGHGDVNKLEFPFVDGRTVAHLDVNEISSLAKIFFPKLNFPKVDGSLNFEVNANRDRGKEIHMEAQVETRDAKIDKFKIGNVFSKIQLNGEHLKAPEIKVDNEGVEFSIQDLQATLNKEMPFSGRVTIKHIELRQLLEDLDVHAPLHMDVSASIPCEGVVTPEFRVECAGDLKGNNFSVYTKEKHKIIAALKEFKLTASMVAEKDKVLFPKALISIGGPEGHTSGAANGIVDYDKGFLFNYHSDHLDTQDLESLADLKYQGVLAITGTTSGTGHTGVMNAQISAKNFWFEDYGLGDVDMNLAFQQGYLKFTQISGHVGETSYNGQTIVQVDDDVGDHQIGIRSGHLNVGQLDLSDVFQTIFVRKTTLPFTATGLGSAQLDMDGPFSLSKLNYKLQTTVYHGQVAGESYKEAHFNVHGIQGHAIADNVSMIKGDGNFSLTGDVLPSGLMNVAIQGRSLRLGDFEHVRSALGDLDGKISADMTLKSYILKPQINLTGSLTQTTLRQQSLEDSSFAVKFGESGISVDGQLFDNKLTGHLLYPFTDNGPFALKFATTNWDFTNLLGILGKSVTRDYETSLTAKIDLASSEGGFWRSVGEASISKLYVRHGTSQMKNAQPITVKFDDGFVNVNQFQILGDNTEIRVTGSKNRKDALNFNIGGRVDLGLLMFLTPFFRDMNGELSLSTQVGGTIMHPDLLGSAFLKKGYFRLEALGQPFEDVDADFLFSQQRILINRLTGHMGGGDLSAGGTLTFKSLTAVPVEITGDLNGAGLTIPDGLTTHGDFHFSITGDWFPYLLKGDYNIQSGLYGKNFENTESDAALKRSVYLPSVILQKNFQPFELDIMAHFQKGVTVKNDLLEADVKGDLEVKGEPAHPILKGEVTTIPGGKILFHDTAFNVTNCDVKFSNPTENNPQLYIEGSTHIRDWDVVMAVQGTEQKYKIDLTSTPPLPEKSIISLLALGITDDDENRAQQSTMQNLAVGLNNPTASEANATAVQYSQAGNLLLGGAVNSAMRKNFGINVRLSQDVDETRNIVMPRVIAEKVWSPKITTTVSRTVGQYITNDADVEYKLNHHFSLLGSYQGRDFDPMSIEGPTTNGQTLNSETIFGLDFQYQMEFR